MKTRGETMKEINIARILVNKRKEKGVTQEELANYIGVSKASVSKWETGQSYPDITFLPQLSTYFNISIDDLMGYEPQITKEEITKLYHKFANDFATKPFDEVLNNCRDIIKKYYSCFPLLLQMGVLILFHTDLAKNDDEIVSLVLEAKELFVRVKLESTDVDLIKKAQYMEANCDLSLKDYNRAIELLEAINTPLIPVETVLSTAYQVIGQQNKALSTLQVGIYQNLVSLFSIFPLHILLSATDPKQYEETLHRAFIVAETFNLEKLLPTSALALYMMAAQGYIVQGNPEKCIEMLKKFTEVITNNNHQFTAHTDDYFDLIGDWLNNLDLGTKPIKPVKLIKQDMINLIVNNPDFSVIVTDQRFKIIIDKLKTI